MARPTKYTESRRKVILEGLRAGLSRYAVSGLAEIDVCTLDNWCERYSSFSEACRIAEQAAAARFESVVIKDAANQNVDTALQWLKRRRRADWGDNVGIDLDREIAGLLEKLAGSGQTEVEG